MSIVLIANTKTVVYGILTIKNDNLCELMQLARQMSKETGQPAVYEGTFGNYTIHPGHDGECPHPDYPWTTEELTPEGFVVCGAAITKTAAVEHLGRCIAAHPEKKFRLLNPYGVLWQNKGGNGESSNIVVGPVS